MSEIAIVTPLYNRKNKILDLYESLLAQTCDHSLFSWYVIDDGSTDGGLEHLSQYIDDADFPIHVMQKDNGGKHTALNVVIPLVTEDLTFIVDSDDILPEDAILTILETFHSATRSGEICGISFLKEMEGCPSPSIDFPSDYLYANYADVRLNQGIIGDKAEVFYSKCLKQVPFPEFDGEPFYHEDGVWLRLAEEYDMLHVNKVVYKGRYLENGLTFNGRQRKLDSPLGMIDRSSVFLNFNGHLKFKIRLKHAMLWDIYNMISGKKIAEIIKSMPSKPLCIAVLLPAAIIGRWWQHEKSGR